MLFNRTGRLQRHRLKIEYKENTRFTLQKGCESTVTTAESSRERDRQHAGTRKHSLVGENQ